MNKINACLILTFVLLALSSKGFGFRFPENVYFPYTPNYSISLVSENSNTIDAQLASIELPDPSDEIDIFFVSWNLKIKINSQQMNYSLRYKVLSDGNIYLLSIRDGYFNRSIEPEALVFPTHPEMNTSVSLGEGISLEYIKSLSSLKVGDKTFGNVNVIRLKMGSTESMLYFSKDIGLVGVKTESETFKIR